MTLPSTLFVVALGWVIVTFLSGLNTLVEQEYLDWFAVLFQGVVELTVIALLFEISWHTPHKHWWGSQSDLAYLVRLFILDRCHKKATCSMVYTTLLWPLARGGILLGCLNWRIYKMLLL